MSLIESKLGWMCVFYFFVVMVRRFPDDISVSLPTNFKLTKPLWDCDCCVFMLQTGGSIVFITPLLVREVRAMWRDRRALRHQL